MIFFDPPCLNSGVPIIRLRVFFESSKPWFTAFKEDTKADDRNAAIEAWRIEKDHVGQ